MKANTSSNTEFTHRAIRPSVRRREFKEARAADNSLREFVNAGAVS